MIESRTQSDGSHPTNSGRLLRVMIGGWGLALVILLELAVFIGRRIG